MNGETENGFGVGARENGVGAGTGVGGDEVEEGAKVVEAVGEGEGLCHPEEGGVGVAEGVDGGGPLEDVEVVVGEGGVVVELGLEEVEEGVGGEGRGEVGLEEMEEAVVVGMGDGGEGEGEGGGNR